MHNFIVGMWMFDLALDSNKEQLVLGKNLPIVAASRIPTTLKTYQPKLLYVY